MYLKKISDLGQELHDATIFQQEVASWEDCLRIYFKSSYYRLINFESNKEKKVDINAYSNLDQISQK
jgi:hypothetical protein